MPKSQQAKLAQKLREQRGFDRSYVADDGYVKVRCSQCEALVINNTACHEGGCPNDEK